MKKNTRFLFSLILLFTFTFVFQTPAVGKEFQSRTINKVIDASPRIEVLHKYGPLQIETSTDGKVHLKAVLSLDAPTRSDAERVFDQFDVEIKEWSGELFIQTIFSVMNWNQNYGLIKIRFKNGVKVKNIQNLKINMVLKVPSLDYLKLKNKYDKIIVRNNLNADLEVALYDGELETKNVSGRLDLSLKYSKATVGNFGDAYFELYECTLNAGNGKDVRIGSKYSKVYLDDVQNLEVEAYEGKGEVENIKNHLELEAKYSNWRFADFNTAKITMYEGSFKAKNGKELTGGAKYADINIQSIGHLRFSSLYETDIDVEEIQKLFLRETKYCTIDIDKLNGSIDAKTYEGKINVNLVANTFGGIDFEGKYTNLSVPISSPLKYRLEADLLYTEMAFDEREFDTSKYIEKNSKINIIAKTKGASSSSPLIKLVAYEGKINL